MHQKGNEKCGSDSRQEARWGGGAVGGWQQEWRGRGAASVCWGRRAAVVSAKVYGSRKPETLAAQRAATSSPRSSGSPPPLPSSLLCTMIRPRQKQPGMGPCLGEDPGANRKRAFTSWTIYSGF